MKNSKYIKLSSGHKTSIFLVVFFVSSAEIEGFAQLDVALSGSGEGVDGSGLFDESQEFQSSQTCGQLLALETGFLHYLVEFDCSFFWLLPNYLRQCMYLWQQSFFL